MSRALPSSEGLTMPVRLRNLVQTPKAEIKIDLLNRKKIWTTGDRLEGTVTITTVADTPLEELEISFVGTARTYVERLTTAAAVSGRTEAFHQFLKLTQPGLQAHYPENNLLKAGQAYAFPFVFGVPQQLLPRICQHKTHNPAVRDTHLLLPPSLGEADPENRRNELDDMAPDMASVRYGVFVKLTKVKVLEDGSYTTAVLASKARRVRVLPTTDELPPLDVSGEDSEYTLRKERTIRKGMLKGKLGTLVMEAAQPQSLRLRAHTDREARTTTMATVMLRFDPSEEDSLPPRLGSLASKLKVCTFFASSARREFPSKNAGLYDQSQGMHTEQLNLTSRCVANVEWTKCRPGKANFIERRDSACSTTSLNVGETPEPSASYKGQSYYVARVLVPIALPTNKAFVPTFHSCLVSRIYQLKLELGLQGTGIGSSMDLKVPIQVSSEARTGEQTSQRGSVDSLAESLELDEDASDFFGPRTIRAHSEGFVGTSRLGSAPSIGADAPPGYTALPQRRHMSVPVY
jgi:hypothetical protein